MSSSSGIAVPEDINASRKLFAGPFVILSLTELLIASALRHFPPDMPSNCSADISIKVSHPPIFPSNSFSTNRSNDCPKLSFFRRN